MIELQFLDYLLIVFLLTGKWYIWKDGTFIRNLNIQDSKKVSINFTLELDNDEWIIAAVEKDSLLMVKFKILSATVFENEKFKSKERSDDNTGECFNQTTFSETCFDKNAEKADIEMTYVRPFTGKQPQCVRFTTQLMHQLQKYTFINTYLHSILTTSFRSMFLKPLREWGCLLDRQKFF